MQGDVCARDFLSAGRPGPARIQKGFRYRSESNDKPRMEASSN